MNFGRSTRAFIVGIACFCLLAQTTPGMAAPPVAAKPVTATSARVQVRDTQGLSTVNAPVSIARPKSNSNFVTAPAVNSSGKATLDAGKTVQHSAIDVTLSPDGALTGRVLDAKKNGVPNTPVVIRHGKQEVARTFTNEKGHFTVTEVRGGMYLVTANNGYGLFRVWTKPTAPPAARQEVLLMSQAVVVRAQNADVDSGEVLYDENGQPYAKIHVVDEGQICEEDCPPVGSGGLCAIDCCALLLLGVSAAALTIALIDKDPDPSSP